MRRVNGRGSPGPRVVLVAGSAEAARNWLEAAREPPWKIAFARVPEDAGALPSIPGGPRIEAPYREDAIPAYAAAAPRLTVRVAAKGFASLDAASEALALLSRSGLASAIEDLEALDGDSARRILDVFLHRAEIVRPIEPFSSLLAAWVRRKEIDLWEACAPSADRLAVEVSGGPAEEAFAARIRERSERRGAESFLYALPRERPECLECGSFFACRGYAAWVGACAPWKAVLEGIAAAAREVRVLSGTRRGTAEAHPESDPVRSPSDREPEELRRRGKDSREAGSDP